MNHPAIRTATAPQADVLARAAALFAERDKLRDDQRDLDRRLRLLCREHDTASGLWGTSPCHLERAVRLQGYL